MPETGALHHVDRFSRLKLVHRIGRTFIVVVAAVLLAMVFIASQNRIPFGFSPLSWLEATWLESAIVVTAAAFAWHAYGGGFSSGKLGLPLYCSILLVLLVAHLFWPFTFDVATLTFAALVGLLILHFMRAVRIKALEILGNRVELDDIDESLNNAADAAEHDLAIQVSEQRFTSRKPGPEFSKVDSDNQLGKIINQIETEIPAGDSMVPISDAPTLLIRIGVEIERRLRGLALCYDINPVAPEIFVIGELERVGALEKHTARYLAEIHTRIQRDIVPSAHMGPEAGIELLPSANRLVRWLGRALSFHWRHAFASEIERRLKNTVERQFSDSRGITKLTFPGAIVEFNLEADGVAIFLRGDTEHSRIPKSIWRHDITRDPPSLAVEEVLAAIEGDDVPTNEIESGL